MNRHKLLNVYIGLVALAAALAVGLSSLSLFHGSPPTGWLVLDVAVLIPLAAVSSSRLLYFSESNRVLMGTVVQIGSIVILPLPYAVLSIAVGKIFAEANRLIRRERDRTLRSAFLNTASTVIAVAVGALAFQVTRGAEHLWQPHLLDLLPAFPSLLFTVSTYYLVDSLIVSGAITLKGAEAFRSVFVQMTKDTLAPEMSLISVGITFGILWHLALPLSLLIAVPLTLSMRSFEAVARLRVQTEQAISQMAASIDMRDTGTGIHSQQLEQHATRLATSLGLTPEHVREIALAARTHDLGKIEISDAILLKKGPLTSDERLAMQEHPVIGANMLASYTGFSKSSEFVRHHHERWDGHGYPDGLKGEEIPIGARIISVVDAYDAMTADRPYRKSMSVDEAVKRLKADIGTQFDPRIFPPGFSY